MPCPECQVSLVSEGDATPWCPRCLWNLDHFEPDPGDGWIARRIARLDHVAGYDLSLQLSRSLSGRQVERPRVGVAALLLAVISGMLLAVVLGMVVSGVWLIIEGNPLLKVMGAVLLVFAYGLRPRLGRLRKVLEEYDEITRDRAPRLFALIDRAAQAAGTPPPHHVLVGPEWNAFASTLGLRRRRVLMLGLPLWSSIRRQERVALLSHELGHFANGDPRTGLLTMPALETFGLVAVMLHPDRPQPSEDGGFFSLFMFLGQWAAYPFLLLASHLCMLVHLGVNMLGARQSQRAEYYADDLAAQVAGSAAVKGLNDVFAIGEGLITVVGARSRSNSGAGGWLEGVEGARERVQPRLGPIRQLTIRQDASMFASHPPAGLRHAVVTEGPHHDAAVVLTETEANAIDAELARYAEPYRRTIAATW